MMEVNAYQYGDTIRFECIFRDFRGRVEDPESIELKIIDGEEDTIITDIVRQSKGFYYYDYVSEEEEKDLIYEWRGSVDVYPRVRRKKIRLKFL